MFSNTLPLFSYFTSPTAASHSLSTHLRICFSHANVWVMCRLALIFEWTWQKIEKAPSLLQHWGHRQYLKGSVRVVLSIRRNQKQQNKLKYRNDIVKYIDFFIYIKHYLIWFDSIRNQFHFELVNKTRTIAIEYFWMSSST